MAGTQYQGTQLYAAFQGENDNLNADMDAALNTIYVQWNWLTGEKVCEPELFPRYMSKAFKCTFSEVKTETNAESFFVHIVYRISR